MEQKKKDILKRTVAKVAPTPGAIVKGSVSSAYIGTKNAINGATSTVSKRLKERFGPIKFDRATLPLEKPKAPKPEWRPATPTELSTPRKLTPEEVIAREKLRRERTTPPSFKKK